MVKLFHTIVTTERHREHGYCEDSDFGKIELIELSPTEKNLIVSFQDYKHKKEFIEYEGCAYLKVGECSNFGGMSRDKEAIWIAKQGKFTRNSAITLMLELRKRFESSFSYVSSAKYILIGKTLYARYSKIKTLQLPFVEICYLHIGLVLTLKLMETNVQLNCQKKISIKP